MRKERKHATYLKEQEKEIELKERFRELEHENKVLKRHVKMPIKDSSSRDPSFWNSSRHLIHLSQDKHHQICRTLKFQVTHFSRSDVQTFNMIGSGVFGKVYKGSIVSMNQVVVIKTVSHSNFLNVLAECKMGIVMNGHRNFPFIYGIMKPNMLLFEFVRDDCGSQSPTIKDFFDNKLDKVQTGIIINICIQLCEAIHDLHIKGILHNDIHPRNVLVKNKQFVKLIDFGKATLINDPVRYSIEPNSERYMKYNRVHLFLAHELRNVPGSYQSIATDIYSVGYNIDFIARNVGNSKISAIATNMMVEDPNKRPPLSRCITFLERYKVK